MKSIWLIMHSYRYEAATVVKGDNAFFLSLEEAQSALALFDCTNTDDDHTCGVCGGDEMYWITQLDRKEGE